MHGRPQLRFLRSLQPPRYYYRHQHARRILIYRFSRSRARLLRLIPPHHSILFHSESHFLRREIPAKVHPINPHLFHPPPDSSLEVGTTRAATCREQLRFARELPIVRDNLRRVCFFFFRNVITANRRKERVTLSVCSIETRRINRG